MKQLLTINHAATVLGLDRAKIYKGIRQGKINVYVGPMTKFVLLDEVKYLLAENIEYDPVIIDGEEYIPVKVAAKRYGVPGNVYHTAAQRGVIRMTRVPKVKLPWQTTILVCASDAEKLATENRLDVIDQRKALLIDDVIWIKVDYLCRNHRKFAADKLTSQERREEGKVLEHDGELYVPFVAETMNFLRNETKTPIGFYTQTEASRVVGLTRERTRQWAGYGYYGAVRINGINYFPREIIDRLGMMNPEDWPHRNKDKVDPVTWTGDGHATDTD